MREGESSLKQQSVFGEGRRGATVGGGQALLYDRFTVFVSF